ncbi:MAG: hypothetical protein ACRC2U_16445 [Aeromonas sp.]
MILVAILGLRFRQHHGIKLSLSEGCHIRLIAARYGTVMASRR